mmetsp:Transcript_2659/g.7806  ORF Transcript_2659/g.7806 Transcript_2659/m.7806 type:complete len:237 (+) Transcript_2659:2813-3523(+)
MDGIAQHRRRILLIVVVGIVVATGMESGMGGRRIRAADGAGVVQDRAEDGVVGANVAEGALEGIVGGTHAPMSLTLALALRLCRGHGREVVHVGDVEVVEQVGLTGAGVVGHAGLVNASGSGSGSGGLLGGVDGVDGVHRRVVVGEAVGADGHGGAAATDVGTAAVAGTPRVVQLLFLLPFGHRRPTPTQRVGADGGGVDPAARRAPGGVGLPPPTTDGSTGSTGRIDLGVDRVGR